MKLHLASFFAIALLVACSASDQSVDSARSAKDLPASQLERLLPDENISLDFPFVLKDDRTVVTDSGVTRRGLALAYEDIPAKSLWSDIVRAFDRAGYSSGALETDPAGKGSLKFSKAGSKALSVSVSPDGRDIESGVIWIGWDVD